MNEDLSTRDLIAIQRRYEYLHLSDEQARQLFIFEQESQAPISGGLSFSFWEEKEYEWDQWRTVLSEEQLALYERDRQESIAGYEASLRRTDSAEWPAEVAIFEEMIGWYKDPFLPAFQREAFGVPVLAFLEGEKIAALRADYQKFLLRARRDTLVNHYRQSRVFQPNGLRLALLRHELLELWPDYGRWFGQTDAATQAVAVFVLERYQGFCRKESAFFQQQAALIQQQWAAVRARHTVEEEIGGWHTTIVVESRWSTEELGMMALLLMDPERKKKRREG